MKTAKTKEPVLVPLDKVIQLAVDVNTRLCARWLENEWRNYNKKYQYDMERDCKRLSADLLLAMGVKAVDP